MKKLVALVLVLALASFVSAATIPFTFQAVGGNDVLAGSTITINCVGDTASTGFLIGGVKVTGAVSGVVKGAVSSAFTGVVNAGTQRDGSQQNVWITGVTGTPAGTNTVAPGTFYTFTVKVGAAGSVVIDDFQGSAYTSATRYSSYSGQTIDMAPITLNIVPEPITIALLGLGGLFLRRRMA